MAKRGRESIFILSESVRIFSTHQIIATNEFIANKSKNLFFRAIFFFKFDNYIK